MQFSAIVGLIQEEGSYACYTIVKEIEIRKIQRLPSECRSIITFK